ncbi:MAG: DUF1887 family protein [Oscillospiraceae bacterium]|nr:DUF1887 family protein [Oscillospiraceae bacterium]
MKTLIELYDERPLENVLGVEMFRPERVIYICPETASSDQTMQNKLRQFFRHRGMKVELVFLRASVYDAEAVLRVFRKTLAQYPDASLDITGGTDAVLFAAGLLSAENDLPVFTYSRRQNRFYNIRNAGFAMNVRCSIAYSVEDCFLMAGGTMRPGRVDNSILVHYMEDIEPFFHVYLKHRKKWSKIITYLQRVSPSTPEGDFSLEVSGRYSVKGERTAFINAPEEALRDLEQIGFLTDLKIQENESVCFRFCDTQIRTWLRDVGSVLELYIYKACLDTGLFDDVITSAVVDWEGTSGRDAVTNELDVMCTRGIIPVFISCKTAAVRTEALNELAILRDRFGGNIAKAAIVTAEKGRTALRNRASELGIDVIDINDLANGRVHNRLQSMMRAGR